MNFKVTYWAVAQNAFHNSSATPWPGLWQLRQSRPWLMIVVLFTLTLATPRLQSQHNISALRLLAPRAVHVGDTVTLYAGAINTDVSGDDWVFTNLFITLFNPAQPDPPEYATGIIPIYNPESTNIVVLDPCYGTSETVSGVLLHPGDTLLASAPYTVPDCDGNYSVITAKLRCIGTDINNRDPQLNCPSSDIINDSPDQITVLRPCIRCTSAGMASNDKEDAIITSTGAVINCGNNRLTNVIVIADKPTPRTIVARFGTNILSPGASFSFSNAYQGSIGANIETFTVSATEENRGQPVVTTVSFSTSSTSHVPQNLPPVIICPTNTFTECGSAATLSAVVADINAEDLTVLWTVNGIRRQTNIVAGSTNAAGTPITFGAALPVGANVVTVEVNDEGTNSVSCTTTATVVDKTPPAIHSVRAQPNVLWPPDRRMIPVNITVDVSDNCDSSPKVKISGVTSNEPEDPKRPDWEITGPTSLVLRAERLGKGQGRVYTITVECKDASGNTTSSSVNVTVPHK